MLPTATLVIATYVITQLIKPALAIKLLPQDAAWSNNALRALVFLIAYALVVVNTIVTHPVDWAGAWGLIPTAAAVAGLAVASFHILSDAAPATPLTASASAPQGQAGQAAPAPAPQRNTQGRFVGKVVTSGQSQTMTVPANTMPHPWPSQTAEGNRPDQDEKGQ